jgi:hypothetical protein
MSAQWRPHLKHSLVLFALLTAFVFGPSAAFSGTDVPTSVSVAVGADTNMAQYGFGDLGRAGGMNIVHNFVLHNTGAQPLTINRFQPSCHCTTAALVPDTELPVTILPGSQVVVQVTVSVEPYLTGPLSKNVEVFVNGQDSAIATLTMTATLHSLVTMDPATLDFGSGPAGQPRSQILTATVDSRLLPPGTVPHLTSTDPDIQVTPLPATAPIPVSATVEQTSTYKYRVTLAANAALGPVDDLLQFAHAPSDPLVGGMGIADGMGVPVTGTVVGVAASTPTSLAFGIVTQGHSSVLPVHLFAPTAQLAAAQVVSASPYLQAAWGKGKSPGSLESELTITLANGQRLRLPVSAYVSAPG